MRHVELDEVLATDAVTLSILRRGKPETLFHYSGRVSRYTSDHFRRALSELGVTCKMSSSGNYGDS